MGHFDHAPLLGNIQAESPRAFSRGVERQPVPVGSGLFQDQLFVGDRAPGQRQIDDRLARTDLQRSKDLLRDMGDQRLHEVHHPADIRVCLVNLEHRELGIVRAVQPLVPEIPVQLEDLVEPAHQQSLQVELRGDAQEHVGAQGVVMRLERIGRGAAGHRLDHRRFDFVESPVEEEFTDLPDRLDALVEQFPDVLVGDQVEVSVAVSQFHVMKAVPFFRERQQGLGKQRPRVDFQGFFARLRNEELALGADLIAQIYALERLESRVAHGVLLDVNLEPRAAVLQVREDAFPHLAFRHHAAGDLFRLLLGKTRHHVAQPGRAFECLAEGFVAHVR